MSGNYGVFISVKHSDEGRGPSSYRALARQVYPFSTDRRLAVFFSRVSLETHGVAADKEAIDNAQDSAHVLVAVGTSSKNLSSKWVCYEWDGFVNDIVSRVKPEGRLFVHVDKVSVSSLPRTLRQVQVVQHGPGGLGHLSRFIVNALANEPDGASSPVEPGRVFEPSRAPASQRWHQPAGKDHTP